MTKKKIQCPNCHQRIIDADSKTKSVLLTPNEIKDGRKADYYTKCPKCGIEVGIKKLQG